MVTYFFGLNFWNKIKMIQMFLQALLANTWNVLKKKDGIFGSIFYNMNANVLKFLFLMRLFLSRVNLIFCYRIKWALKWWLKYLSTNQIFFKLTHFWWFSNTVKGKLYIRLQPQKYSIWSDFWRTCWGWDGL